MHALAHYGVPVVVGLLVLAFGVVVGRKWRRQYKGAVAYRLELEQSLAAASRSTATAQASGNRVDIHLGNHNELGPGESSLIIPSVVRARVDSGVDARKAALDGDVSAIPAAISGHGATAFSRLLFGREWAVPRALDSGGRSDESSKE